MYVITIDNLLVTNTCLGPSTRTAQTYSDASTKNAISHLRRVHRLGPDGELPTVAIRQQSLREAFGNTTPRIAFNPEMFKAILLRWMTICNNPFNAVENNSFRLLAGYLAACVRSRYSFLSYVYLLIVQTASYTAIPRQHNSIVDPRYVPEVANTHSEYGQLDRLCRTYQLGPVDESETSELSGSS